MTSPTHIPVLLDEVLNALRIRVGGRYIDGTFGRGGHTREILKRGGDVLAIDRDAAAIEWGERNFQNNEGPNGSLTLVRGNHGDLAAICAEHGLSAVDGILLDLGVSSPQLDEGDRGFSFQKDGPLDMRMDQSGGVTAADIVNNDSAEELEGIFRNWGEEPQARRIARAIVETRAAGHGKRFATTGELATFIESIVGRRGPHHPATRVFQALRFEVNDEMGALERALDGSLGVLKPGGRLAIITFESLTDRVVKKFFAAHVGKMRALQQGGEIWEGATPRCLAVTRKVIVAGENEQKRNPRSRSAKLRVVERAVEQ